LDDGSAYIETSIATNETEKQNVNKNVDIKSGENPLEPSQADAHDVRLIKPFSFENLQNRDDEASLNVHELTLRQARSGDLKCNEAETAKQPTHGQSQPGDSQLATHEPVVNLQLQIQSMESKHAGEISDLQTKLQQAEKQSAEYQQNFDDAQEQVFSLQPRRSDITEDDAASEYSILRVNVENWIESHLGAALDLDHKIFAQSKVDIASGSRLLALIEITHRGAKSRDVPGTLPYYLRNAIMNFICVEIFQPELHDAVAGPWEFLQTIEASMRTLEPRRGKFSCAPWQYVIVYKNHGRPSHSPRMEKRNAHCSYRHCRLPKCAPSAHLQVGFCSFQMLTSASAACFERTARIAPEISRGGAHRSSHDAQREIPRLCKAVLAELPWAGQRYSQLGQGARDL
jgi:hypothetical protein